MRKWIFATGLIGALVLQGTAITAAAATDTASLRQGSGVAALHWSQSPFPDARSTAVSFLEATQVRGRLLPLVLGIATFDLTLATFYWGVYVPYYADQEPSFDESP